MRKTYQVLAYLLAVEVVVQAAAIAYGIAGLGHWIDDNHTLTKPNWDSDNSHFTGAGGLALHGINGIMFIPVLTVLLLIISFFAKVPGGVKWAGILFGLLVLQIVLGLAAGNVPWLAPLHVINAFAIMGVAAMAGKRAGAPAVA